MLKKFFSLSIALCISISSSGIAGNLQCGKGGILIGAFFTAIGISGVTSGALIDDWYTCDSSHEPRCCPNHSTMYPNCTKLTEKTCANGMERCPLTELANGKTIAAKKQTHAGLISGGVVAMIIGVTWMSVAYKDYKTPSFASAQPSFF